MAEGTVAILGLGLIGGSLARDLSALGHRVLGFDRDPATRREAEAEGIVKVMPDAALSGLEDADVVVLAVPVGAARHVLAGAAPRIRASLVTDVGSTKRSVVAAAEAAGLSDRFVGSHPLAGDHRSGWEASRAGLFRGAPCFLCPADDTAEDAIRRAGAFWRSVGAAPQVISAEEHDTRMAWVSHLPQATASVLGAALAASGHAAAALGPGGRDTTRLAASSTALWTDILLDNADRVGPALDALAATVDLLRGALRRGDGAEVAHVLTAARAWKDATRPG